MHINYGTIIKFNQCRGCLYYYHTTNMENKNTNNQFSDYFFINTVQSNKSYFHKREIKGAYTAKILQQLV